MVAAVTEAVLTMENVSFSYTRQPVLEDISLTVYAGDFLGIVGPNGSGKSTLLKLILHLLRPTAGRILLFGTEQSQFRQWTQVGYVPQKATAFHHGFPATVREVVQSGLTASLGLFRRPGASGRKRVDEALEQVGVSGLRDRIIGELSGGQQQRVLIAKALVSGPRLLILDEPTVGVDLQAQEQFYSLLATLRLQGMTLVMVSHDIGVVTEHVGSVACLNRKLYFHGPPADFVARGILGDAYGAAARILHHAH
jgi:zinc transport system ATP-binding protein